MSDRNSRREGMKGVDERRTYRLRRENISWRSKPDGTGGSVLHFDGYASLTEAPYPMVDWWGDEYLEVVSSGAFKRTLNAEPDVPLLIGHDTTGIPLARTKSGTLTLAEDDIGLRTEADLDGSSPLVQSLRSAMERGDMDEMSFAFRVRSARWSPDYTERRLNELDIHRGDVSIVVHGANEGTSASLRGAAALLERIDHLSGDDLRAAFARLQRRMDALDPGDAGDGAGDQGGESDVDGDDPGTEQHGGTTLARGMPADLASARLTLLLRAG